MGIDRLIFLLVMHLTSKNNVILNIKDDILFLGINLITPIQSWDLQSQFTNQFFQIATRQSTTSTNQF